MLSPSHIRCVDIFVEPRNFLWTWLFIYFLNFLLCQKKRRNPCGIFFFLITQPFLYLEGALKLISQKQFKNTTTKVLQVWQHFRGSSKISRHRIWEGEHISQFSTGDNRWQELTVLIYILWGQAYFENYSLQCWWKLCILFKMEDL